jgi:WD40 repeat protein
VELIDANEPDIGFGFKLTRENQPPTITDLVAEPESPQEVGTAITLTADALDVDDDQLLYRFFLDDEPLTDWISENYWIWTTDEAGSFQVEAQVRDGMHAEPDGFDDRKSEQFEINEDVSKENEQLGPQISLAFSPDSQILASGSTDGNITLWDITSGMKIRNLNAFDWWILGVAFSPDGSTLASTALQDPAVRLWDTTSWTEISTLTSSADTAENAPFSIAFSPDSTTLAVADVYCEGKDNYCTGSSIVLWNMASNKEIGALIDPDSWTFCLAFSPDGRYLASGSGDSTITLWDVASQTKIGTFAGHSGNVMSVAFSPDGRTLASGSNDNTIKLWDLTSRMEIGTLVGHSGSVLSVAFSPDGQILASGGGCGDFKVRLWDLASQIEIGTFYGHAGPVFSVAFSPDGRALASAGSTDCTVKLWNVASQIEIATLGLPASPSECIELAPEMQSDCRTPDSKKCHENVDLVMTV